MRSDGAGRRKRGATGLAALVTCAGCAWWSGGCAGPGAGASPELVWNPTERLFAPYVADPRRARFGIAGLEADSELEDAGGERVALEIGGRLDVLRHRPLGEPDGGVQLSIDAGYVGDFDRESSLDNLAWSGTYALQLAWRAAERLALRIGFAHESSHLGDEFVEETGRARVNYTRDELRLGASWRASPPVRLYAEYGHALHRGNNSLLERGRGQLGAEWESPELRAGHAGWYGAADVSAFEESDWDANAAVAAGWAVPRGPGRGTWRLGTLLYDGRSPIGELFQEDETRVAVGVWFDL